MVEVAAPLSALISQVRILRAVAVEPHAATDSLRYYILSATHAFEHHGDGEGSRLLGLLERYGWAQRDQAFGTLLDLMGMYHALQKFKYQKLTGELTMRLSFGVPRLPLHICTPANYNRQHTTPPAMSYKLTIRRMPSMLNCRDWERGVRCCAPGPQQRDE